MSTVWDPGVIIHFSVGKCSYTELFEVMEAVNFGVHDEPQWGSLGFIMNPKVIFGIQKFPFWMIPDFSGASHEA